MDLLTISFGTFLRSLSLYVPICASSDLVGDVAQTVERALSMREVMGSMPIFSTLLDSIVVSISACHADDPGSVSGRGVNI